jgi:hypothetical protein
MGLYENFEESGGDSEERVSILVALESFLVRRMVCWMTTKNHNRLSLDLLMEMMREGRFSYDGVRSFLSSQTSEANRWPNEREFKESWCNNTSEIADDIGCT